jgi:hypothetical protein
MTSDCCIPAPPHATMYDAGEIIIYGTRLNSLFDYAKLSVPQLSADTTYSLRVQLFEANNDDGMSSGEYAIVVAYGYAYEGHCYRLDRPKVLLLLQDSEDEAAEGCGFFANESDPSYGYRMWRVQSKTMLLELGIVGDFAEQLLLDANLPGRRAPNTYNAQAAVGHRGGRLTSNRSEV